MSFKCFFFVLFLPFLIAGCRSSRSGVSHSELETNYLKESRGDSIDFRKMFARYLAEQESRLRARVIEYYPPEPGDTANHGAVKSVTNLDFSSKSKSDSIIEEKQLTYHSDTTSLKGHQQKEENTTYKIKQLPWYQPFIPYFIVAILAVILYYFRKK